MTQNPSSSDRQSFAQSPKKDLSAEDLWAKLSLAALVALSALVAYALFFTSPATGSHGLPHPDVTGMLRGGSGVDRHGPLLLIGWAIGVAEILFFGALMALGARRGPSLGGPAAGQPGSRTGLRGLGAPMSIGLVVALGVWTLLMVSYAGYLDDPEPALYLALPAPTATMLYLLWGVPLIFAALYVIGFRRWVYSPEDEAAFTALVEKRRAAGGDSAGGDSAGGA